MKNFENLYKEFDDALFNKYYKGLLSFEELENIKKKLFESFFTLINKYNLKYATYLKNEFKTLVELKSNNNTYNLKFSKDFEPVYSKRALKFQFLMMLLNYKQPNEDISDILISIGNYLIDAGDSELNFGYIEWILDILKIYKNENNLSFIDKVVRHLDDNWFKMDIAYGIYFNLKNYKNRKGYEIINQNTSHKVERLAETFRDMIKEYQEEGIVDRNENWISDNGYDKK